MTLKWKIKLKILHDKTGLSPYMVAKESGVAQNTVKKYVKSDEVVVGRFDSALLALLRFYGVDWRDPAVVEIVEVENTDDFRDTIALAEPA